MKVAQLMKKVIKTEILNTTYGTVTTKSNTVENEHPKGAQIESKSGEESPGQASNEINKSGQEKDTPELKDKIKPEEHMHESEKTGSKGENGNQVPEEDNEIINEDMHPEETTSGEETPHNLDDEISTYDEAQYSPEKDIETGVEDSSLGSKGPRSEENTDNTPEENNGNGKEDTYPEEPTSGEENYDQQTDENIKHDEENNNSDKMTKMKPDSSDTEYEKPRTKLENEGENHEDNNGFSNERRNPEENISNEDNPQDEPVYSYGSEEEEYQSLPYKSETTTEYIDSEFKKTKSGVDKPDHKSKEIISDQEGNFSEYPLSDEDTPGQNNKEFPKSDGGQESSSQKYQATTLENSPTSESGFLDPSPTTENPGASSYTFNPESIEYEDHEIEKKGHFSREVEAETPSTQNEKSQNDDSAIEEIQNSNSDVDTPYPADITGGASESDSNRREENKVIDLQHNKNKPASKEKYEPAYGVTRWNEYQQNKKQHSNENTPATNKVEETTTERNLEREFEHRAVNQNSAENNPTGSETTQPVTGGDVQNSFEEIGIKPKINKSGEDVTEKLTLKQELATTQSPMDSENKGA